MAVQQIILDRYRVKKKAGSGGYASVFHAYDMNLKRDVAIKVIPLSQADVARAHLAAMDARLREDFVEEAKPAAALPKGDSDIIARLDAISETIFGSKPKQEPEAELSLPAGEANAAGADVDSDVDPDIEEDDLFDHIPGLQEARMVAKLVDENIVTVYDCVLQDNTAYIIMEYVEGKTLAQIMDESSDRLTLDVIAAVFSSVAHALDVAHTSEVLHLDIKPDNVMINKKGVVKVTDFGLATLLDASGHGTAGGGTIGYMPLEQMRQENLDARTDEWALASLTYEMISDSNPFFADTLNAAETAIEEAELVLPSLCWDGLSPKVDDIMFKALDLEPADRYATVAKFAESLEPHLGDPKQGRKELAKIVCGVEAEETPVVTKVSKPSVPIAERIGDGLAKVFGRIVAALGAAALSALGLINIHLAEGSAWGLATDALPIFGALLAIAAVAAIIKPHAGALTALVIFSAALLANGEYAVGAVTLTLSIAWWWLMGRKDNMQPCLVLLQPLFGAVGFAALGPVLAGCFLTLGRATSTAVFMVLLSLVFAGLGSNDLMGWNAVVNLHFSNVSVQSVLVNVLADPQVWCIAASWVIAAIVVSIFCIPGKKFLDVTGTILAAVALIVGVCAAAGFASGWTSVLPSVSSLVGSLFPGVIGIAVAAQGIADRMRWEPEAKNADEESSALAVK